MLLLALNPLSRFPKRVFITITRPFNKYPYSIIFLGISLLMGAENESSGQLKRGRASQNCSES